LLAWEEELERECCALLLPIVLQTSTNDRWIWQLHASSKYNVTSVYNFLTSRDQPSNIDHNTIIWHKEVPLKVNIFALGLLRNCLPTTNNLIRQRVLQPNRFFFYSRGCGSHEDSDHLFLTGDYFGQIWYEIYNWLRVVSAKLVRVKDHFLIFRSLGGFSRNICSTFYLIWFLAFGLFGVTGMLEFFQQKGNSIIQLIDKIKLQSF